MSSSIGTQVWGHTWGWGSSLNRQQARKRQNENENQPSESVATCLFRLQPASPIWPQVGAVREPSQTVRGTVRRDEMLTQLREPNLHPTLASSINKQVVVAPWSQTASLPLVLRLQIIESIELNEFICCPTVPKGKGNSSVLARQIHFINHLIQFGAGYLARYYHSNLPVVQF